MKNQIFILIAICLLTYSCCSNKLTTKNKKYWLSEIYGEEPFLKNQVLPKKITLPEFYKNHGYIFPKEYQPFWGKRFTPTIEDVRNAENKLKNQNDSLGINTNLKKRYRQYIGNYNKDNKKIIHINFITLKKSCYEKSEFNFLINKQFFQISDNPSFNKIISDRVIIE